MTPSQVYAPGKKGHRDENFPVASRLIGKKYRGPILAYYRFARAADDVADHPDLNEHEKILQLDRFEETLLGHTDLIAAALPLRDALRERDLPPRHALDLLIAFRQDARKQRYRDWNDLLQYCAYSAAPVGRFVLDVHGESTALWPASDGLCVALQIINHLQDCKADYQRLNRVYIPQEALARHGVEESALAGVQATPALRACLSEMVEKTQLLMNVSHFASQVRDMRLGLEVAVIERVAHQLLGMLRLRDPLSQRVHLRKSQFILLFMRAIVTALATRPKKLLPEGA